MLSTKGTRTHFRLPLYFVLAEAAKLCVAAGCVVDKDDQVPSCKHGHGKSSIYIYIDIGSNYWKGEISSHVTLLEGIIFKPLQ